MHLFNIPEMEEPVLNSLEATLKSIASIARRHLPVLSPSLDPVEIARNEESRSKVIAVCLFLNQPIPLNGNNAPKIKLKWQTVVRDNGYVAGMLEFEGDGVDRYPAFIKACYEHFAYEGRAKLSD